MSVFATKKFTTTDDRSEPAFINSSESGCNGCNLRSQSGTRIQRLIGVFAASGTIGTTITVTRFFLLPSNYPSTSRETFAHIPTCVFPWPALTYMAAENIAGRGGGESAPSKCRFPSAYSTPKTHLYTRLTNEYRRVYRSHSHDPYRIEKSLSTHVANLAESDSPGGYQSTGVTQYKSPVAFAIYLFSRSLSLLSLFFSCLLSPSFFLFYSFYPFLYDEHSRRKFPLMLVVWDSRYYAISKLKLDLDNLSYSLPPSLFFVVLLKIDRFNDTSTTRQRHIYTLFPKGISLDFTARYNYIVTYTYVYQYIILLRRHKRVSVFLRATFTDLHGSAIKR